ncbi:hypothetical protein EDL79_02845 [Ehrlichia ruminantium]|uniref:Uncharacterized protein n=1 Tax=Ehrlichia ruminantium TaxID=779 RepID=A0AAE6UJK5_EHRRU|nr:hypothetical protein [Ehrlichia ruminantium]QGR02571.1 hypothetical protein EDL81_02835 [Ehrlichia ruminantium]QGR03491.1 hypothetical protein EDL80_02835 [Ehrlichia ruminantium]QGR04416.1 hypothetical protein EDL79_02845 [Ehrlichia ruminantium]
MPFFEDTTRTASVVGGLTCLIFVGNILMRYFCNGNNDTVIVVLCFLSIGIVIFFATYGSNKDPLTFTKLKVYGMLIASTLIMFCITNIILKKENADCSQLKKQKQCIRSLEIQIINLRIKLSVIKREAELHFSGFGYNNQICTDINRKYLLSENIKYSDYYTSYRIINFIMFGMALLIFLSQAFHSAMFETSDLKDLALYCVLVSFLLIMFIVDKLLSYRIVNELNTAQKEYKVYEKTLNGQFVKENKQYSELIKSILNYNTLNNTKVTEAQIEKLEQHKNKILEILK